MKVMLQVVKMTIGIKFTVRLEAEMSLPNGINGFGSCCGYCRRFIDI